MKGLPLIIIAVLAIGYLALFPLSAGGYGYAGDDGYDDGPSLFYMGGPKYYPNRSLRNGSVGGPGDRYGLHAGK